MKTQIRSLATVLVAVSTLWLGTLPGRAQDTTISAAEFQRMVYSGHLLTLLDENPELDACLQVLLEVQRRNPTAAPTALADVARQALARYRTNAPVYIRNHGFRDEILAAYLDALRQVPARTNVVLANLSLLNDLITRAPAPTGEPQADLVHSGSRLVLSGENDTTERQALVDTCAARAQGNAAFAAAMDSLLVPTETSVSLADSPAAIIGNTNSALYGNYTMQTLLALSQGSGDGSLTVSSNTLVNLFTNETQTLWDTINTNLALQAEINQGQPDLLTYLTNQTALAADNLRVAAVRQGQARTLASATAAILIQSKLATGPGQSGKPSQLSKYSEGVFKIVKGIAGLTVGTPQKPLSLGAKAEGVFNIVSGAYSIFGLATEEPSESPDEEIVREIGNVKTLIQDLSANQNYRFDRVDQSLVTIFNTLNTQFDKIETKQNETGQQIAYLTDNVNNIRLSLLGVQTELNRIERNLATFSAIALRNDLKIEMNQALGYEATAGNPMPYDLFSPNYYVLATDFYTYAKDTAILETLSRNATLPFGDQYFYDQLSAGGSTNVYAETLNYIKRCLRDGLNLTGFPAIPTLANPQDWNAGAGAWLQLAVENPGHFRKYDRLNNSPNHLADIINKGNDLTNFFGSLTFNGSTINGLLYNAVTNYYANNLLSFISKVQATEQLYATNINFDLNTWRQWAAAAPRVNTSATEILISPEGLPRVALPAGATWSGAISQGTSHALALWADGTVMAWGDNSSGQTNVLASAINVVAVAAGNYHSLALRADGTVVGWGNNGYGQATGVKFGAGGLVTVAGQPLTNAVAIAGGFSHSLALKADGTVVGWGNNINNQLNIPGNLTNVIAIAAGGILNGSHSVALKANGTVVGWGEYNNGSTIAPVPGGLSNVVAIAAGSLHSMALKSNGTVLAWGDNTSGQSDVPPGLVNVVAIAAGGNHCLAIKADGTTVAWGDLGPIIATNVVAVAAGEGHSLAVKADGTLFDWGNSYGNGRLALPADLTDAVAIAAGDQHNLALTSDGMVVAWGYNELGQLNIPPNATNVVAIAAGDNHNLALKANGGVVAWGLSDYGQIGVPVSASDVVAIAAGQWQSLALRADGVVVGWGNTTVPASATNMVAIAAGGDQNLALTADGSVVGWGSTTVPANATNAVAIAAGANHCLALKANGSVVGWGSTTVPASATNVVAISAGGNHSLALRADGSVVAWGDDSYGQTDISPSATDVVAIAAGAAHSLLLRSSNGGSGPNRSLIRAQIPRRVAELFLSINTNLIATLQPLGSNYTNAFALSGPKALLAAVLELGMPYTLERDDVLHGFLYGNESLVDLNLAETFLQDETTNLQANPEAKPQALGEVAVLRFQRFQARLNERLADLQATGQPEIPRLVGHTLRLLNLLRDSWSVTPPSSLEIGSKTNGVGLVLYGEPYARYTLQQSGNPTGGWTNTAITTLRSADSPIGIVSTNLPITGAPQGYIRAAQPVP